MVCYQQRLVFLHYWVRQVKQVICKNSLHTQHSYFKIVYSSVMDRMKPKNTNEAFANGLRGKPGAKQEMNSTPIRTRDLHNKQNNNLNNRAKDLQRRPSTQEVESCNSGIQSLGNSKTIPKRKISVSPRGCANHAELEAEFKIEIEGEVYGYCGKCAAHLASNGFPVERMASRSPKPGKEGRSPHLKKRQQLSTFLNYLRKLQQDYRTKGDNLHNIRQGFEHQKQNISTFYSQMIEYISYIRDEHLQFLEDQSQRSSQICEIQGAEIQQTLQQIKSMREDIEQNMDKIISEVQEESYVECMSYYQQKKGLHEHRLEQLGDGIKPTSFATEEFIEQKLNAFKDFVDDITGVLSSRAESVEY